MNSFNAGGAHQKRVIFEEKYNKRITDDIEKLVECFADIVKTGENKDKDKFKIAQEGYQTESQAAQIARSTESLLVLITELKQNLLLNDTKTLLRFTEERTAQLTQQTDKVKETVRRIRTEVAEAIFDMESVFYRSQTGP